MPNEPTAALCSVPARTHLNDGGTGIEWIVDALECDVDRLRDFDLICDLCGRLITELRLNVLGEPQQHRFPHPGGVTALYMLRESHLACHTYPEFGLATFNLYCCRVRPPWDWNANLRASLGSKLVRINEVSRGIGVSGMNRGGPSRGHV